MPICNCLHALLIDVPEVWHMRAWKHNTTRTRRKKYIDIWGWWYLTCGFEKKMDCINLWLVFWTLSLLIWMKVYMTCLLMHKCLYVYMFICLDDLATYACIFICFLCKRNHLLGMGNWEWCGWGRGGGERGHMSFHLHVVGPVQ